MTALPRLALAAVSALAGGVVSLIVLSSDAALDTLRFWQLGSVAARGALLPGDPEPDAKGPHEVQRDDDEVGRAQRPDPG